MKLFDEFSYSCDKIVFFIFVFYLVGILVWWKIYVCLIFFCWNILIVMGKKCFIVGFKLINYVYLILYVCRFSVYKDYGRWIG